MNLLGIQLHTPDARGLFVAALMSLLGSAVGTGLMVAGVLTLSNVAALVVGVFGGSLAHAYGVSVSRDGWRAMVLVTGFVGALGLLAFGAFTLIQ